MLERPLKESLQQVRKVCDDLKWCRMIYQPNCNTMPKEDGTSTGTTKAPQPMYLCGGLVPPADDSSWFSCLWEKSKFKIMTFGIMKN